jgi:hypothetical protein
LLASLSAALRVNALKLSPTFTAASEIAAFAVSLNPINFFTSFIAEPLFSIGSTIYCWDMRASEINYCKDIAVLF